MSTPTDLPRPTSPPCRPARHRRRRAACSWPARGRDVAAGAVGRFLTAGRSGPGLVPDRSGGYPARRLIAITSLEGRVAANADDRPRGRRWPAPTSARANASGDPAYYDARPAGRRQRPPPRPRRRAHAGGHAVVALAVHDFATAATAADAALAADPIDPDALAAAVDAAVELGRYDDAERLLQRLLDVKPGRAGAGPGVVPAASCTATWTAPAPPWPAPSRPPRTAGERAGIASYAGDIALAAGDLAAAARRLRPGPRPRARATWAPRSARARVQYAQGDLAGARAAAQAVVDRAPAAGGRRAGRRPGRRRRRRPTPPPGPVRSWTPTRSWRVASGVTGRPGGGARGGRPRRPDARPSTWPSGPTTHARTVFTADALGWALTKAGRPADALRYVRESLALGTANAALHVHAAAAFAAAGRSDDAARRAAHRLRPVAVARVPPAPRRRPPRGHPRACPFPDRGGRDAPAAPPRRRRARPPAPGRAVVPAGRADAHPLGNLTVNAAVDVVVRADRLDVELHPRPGRAAHRAGPPAHRRRPRRRGAPAEQSAWADGAGRATIAVAPRSTTAP